MNVVFQAIFYYQKALYDFFLHIEKSLLTDNLFLMIPAHMQTARCAEIREIYEKMRCLASYAINKVYCPDQRG